MRGADASLMAVTVFAQSLADQANSKQIRPCGWRQEYAIWKIFDQKHTLNKQDSLNLHERYIMGRFRAAGSLIRESSRFISADHFNRNDSFVRK